MSKPLLRVALWPYRLPGSLSLPPSLRTKEDAWGAPDLFRFALATSPVHYGAQIAVELSIFSLGIALTVLLGRAIGDVGAGGSGKLPLLLMAVVLLRFVLGTRTGRCSAATCPSSWRPCAH
jgi:hypothetical protein